MLFVGQWTSAHVVAKGERERDIYIEREYIYIYIKRERKREIHLTFSAVALSHLHRCCKCASPMHHHITLPSLAPCATAPHCRE
jgi:hypothetical protein